MLNIDELAQVLLEEKQISAASQPDEGAEELKDRFKRVLTKAFEVTLPNRMPEPGQVLGWVWPPKADDYKNDPMPGSFFESHPFQGRRDRWCEICNTPDRNPIHKVKEKPKPDDDDDS